MYTCRPLRCPLAPTCRPYLATALGFAAVSLPLGAMKLAVLRHSQWARRQWPPFIALYSLHMAFAAAQVVAAQARTGQAQQLRGTCDGACLPRAAARAAVPARVPPRLKVPLPAPAPALQRIAEWARNRWEHGLGGPGYPWQEGEEGWLVAGQLQAQAEEGQAAGGFAGFGAAAPDHDVPAEQLADPDSRWAQCGGLNVHYKLAVPLVSCWGPAVAWRRARLQAVLGLLVGPDPPTAFDCRCCIPWCPAGAAQRGRRGGGARAPIRRRHLLLAPHPAAAG